MVPRIAGMAMAAALTLAVATTPMAAAAGPQQRQATPQSTVVAIAAPDVEEIDGLEFMREEEKLARDVYLEMAELWEVPVFSNIASSEQTHMDAVKRLLDRYSIADSASGTPGVFANEELQALYDQLVAKGSESLVGALEVGAAIEEIDIVDLEERLAQTDQSDIQRVYENLLRGSRNHLRAFTSNIERQTGETYSPEHLDTDEYAEVVSGSVERGANARVGQRGGWRR